METLRRALRGACSADLQQRRYRGEDRTSLRSASCEENWEGSGMERGFSDPLLVKFSEAPVKCRWDFKEIDLPNRRCDSTCVLWNLTNKTCEFMVF
jgi:hypothetical protein